MPFEHHLYVEMGCKTLQPCADSVPAGKFAERESSALATSTRESASDGKTSQVSNWTGDAVTVFTKLGVLLGLFGY